MNVFEQIRTNEMETIEDRDKNVLGCFVTRLVIVLNFLKALSVAGKSKFVLFYHKNFNQEFVRYWGGTN